MNFVSAGQMKFIFPDRWMVFRAFYFNRPGNNSGWLISKLYKITDSEKEETH